MKRSVPTLTLINDRKHTGTSKKPSPVEIRVTFCGKQKYVSTGIKVLPSEWNKSSALVKGREDAVQLNAILFKQKAEVLEVVMDLYGRDALDLSKLDAYLKHNKSGESFLAFCESYIDKRCDVAAGTRIHWRAWVNKMREWGKVKTFEDVTKENVERLDIYLRAQGKKQNTICGYHKKFKMFIGEAVRCGYMKENPYTKYQIKIAAGEPCMDRFLTEEEINRLSSAAMPTESLVKVRDMFLFQCLTGLAYKDLANFDKSCVVKCDDGTMMYDSRRVKTNVVFIFVLLPKAVEILDKYDWHLPIMSNYQYNLRLKVVAQAAGIEKPISSHWGRHTAAMVWLNNGIPLEIVSRCLGHSSTRITQKVYARYESESIKKAFEGLKKYDWMK